LKLLVDPAFTAKDTKKCATNYYCELMAKVAMKAIPDLFVYYVEPAGDDWIVREMISGDRVKRIPMECYRDRYKEYLTIKESWVGEFAHWGNHWDWDVLLTTKSPMVGFAKALSAKSHAKRIVIMEPLPMFNFKRTVSIQPGAEWEILTLSGYLNAELILVNTEHERRGILESARRLLSPSKVLDIANRVQVGFEIGHGLDWDAPFKRELELDRKLKVLYTQRLDKSERRPDRVFAVFKQLFVTDNNIAFEVCTNSASRKTLFDEYDFLRLIKPDREEYWERLRNGHVYVSFSIEEGMPLSLLEATVTGLIGVVKSERWSRDMYGPDYPWLVGSEVEAVAAIKAISKNYTREYAKFLDWYKAWFIPMVKERGQLTAKFRNFMVDYDAELKQQYRTTKKTNSDGREISWLINENRRQLSQNKLEVGSMMKELWNWKEARRDYDGVGNQRYKNVPLKRGPSLYETRLKLIYGHGWKDRIGVGELIKEEPVAVGN